MAEKKQKPAAKKTAAKRGTRKGPEAAERPATARAEAAGSAPQPATEQRQLSPKIAVVNSAGETIREIQLSPVVFGAKPGAHLVYEAVKQYRAGGRAGTHKTKNRALVSGSGKKPWRQKGTGRARVGETRNPLWRHGGTVFGPQPRDYSWSMPKKARAAALRVALSDRLREGAVKIVEAVTVDEPKTKGRKVSTMSWGTAKAIQASDRLPDLIVDRGGPGKEAMVRVLGRRPADVVGKVRRIAL